MAVTQIQEKKLEQKSKILSIYYTVKNMIINALFKCKMNIHIYKYIYNDKIKALLFYSSLSFLKIRYVQIGFEICD